MGIVAPRKDLFGREFQKGLLRLALENDEIALKLNQFLYFDVDTKDSLVFADSALTFIFKVICESAHRYGVRPSPSQVIESIKAEGEKDASKIMDCYMSILKTPIHDYQFHKDKITHFFKRVKISKMAHAMEQVWSNEESLEPVKILAKYADDIARVSMDHAAVFQPNDIFDVIKDFQSEKNKPIPTGFKLLDDLLSGGLPRGELVGILGVANEGKSLVAGSIAANAARQGYRVLAIPIEGTFQQEPFRYMANLSGVVTAKFYQNSLEKSDEEILKETAEKYQNNLIVHPYLKFNATIEEIAALARDYYKKYQFDVLVVDYGRLLSTVARVANLREKLELVHNGLSQLAKEFNCVCITPVQANRDAFIKRTQNNDTRSKAHLMTVQLEDIGEAISISQMTGIVLGINRTQEERRNGTGRIQLLKQRQGSTMEIFSMKFESHCSRFWSNDGYLVTNVVDSSDMVTNQEAANKVKTGEVTAEDRKKLMLRDAFELGRKVLSISDTIHSYRKKADSAATPETKAKYAEEILKLEERGKKTRLDAVAIMETYYEGQNPTALLPSLKDSYKEMELASSTFSPEQREETKLLVHLTEWLVKSKEKAAT